MFHRENRHPGRGALVLCLAASLLAADLSAQLQGDVRVGRLDGLRQSQGAGSVSGLGGFGGSSGGEPPLLGGSGDSDNDGLSNAVETAGWQIVIDEFGYGPSAPIELFTIRTVFSDPNSPDSDGDRLLDVTEYYIGTDPQSEDTDGDGLLDRDEYVAWLSNPNTVDSDGDARGPQQDLAPNANLFDGQELDGLFAPRTSPSLADTDGDGRTDYEEVLDPSYDPVVAELPRADLIIAGDLDVRLDVVYEESVAGEVAYEVSLNKSTTATTGTEESTSTTSTSGSHLDSSETDSWEASASEEAGFETVFPPTYSAKVTVSAGGGGSTTTESGTYDEVGQESVFTTSSETSTEAGETHSNYISDTNAFTETAATGTVTLPIQILNEGRFSFTLTNLGISLLRYEQPGLNEETGSFKAMGTIIPQLPSVTLAPGETSPILTLSSGDLNADVVKDFLAAPGTLVLQPASFDLLDQNGLDLDFIRETTFTRTALIEIDFGQGDVRSFRVATNVDRDGTGHLLGLSLAQALSENLGLAYEVTPLTQMGQAVIGADPQGNPSPISVLTSLDGKQTTVMGEDVVAFWVVFREDDFDEAVTAPDTYGGQFVDFESIRLSAGDTVRLVYTCDVDGDDLWEVEEKLFGTTDATADTDGDGLTDQEEAVEGWDVTVFPNGLFGPGAVTTRVYSNPLVADTDGDGLDDFDEKGFSSDAFASDPQNPDTDGDGLGDAEDPYTVFPARRLYVTAGLDEPPWFGSLSFAFQDAADLNSDADPANDIAEIWVASGSHTIFFPSGFPRGNVKVYGGFTVGDTKLGQRDPDPLTNGCILVGPSAFEFNNVGFGVPNGTLDGFSISGIEDDGIATDSIETWGAVTLRNLLFAANTGVTVLDPDGSDLIENCVFTQNDSEDIGCLRLNGVSTVRDTQFVLNRAGLFAGAVYVATHSNFERCLFLANRTTDVPEFFDIEEGFFQGGGAMLAPSASIVDCDFVGNRAHAGGAILFNPMLQTEILNIVNSRFYGNQADNTGSAVLVSPPIGSSPAGALAITNCSFSRNDTDFIEGVLGRVLSISGLSDFALPTAVSLRNNVSFGNLHVGNVPSNSSFEATISNLGVIWDTADLDISFCLTGGPFEEVFEDYLFTNQWEVDPLFQNADAGNLRLSSDSPALDAGLSFVDVEPFTPGFQLPPATDLDGNPRIVDGDGVSGAQIDIGAYEYQP